MDGQRQYDRMTFGGLLSSQNNRRKTEGLDQAPEIERWREGEGRLEADLPMVCIFTHRDPHRQVCSWLCV